MSSRLKEYREAAGWTQAELASRAGVSRQLVGAVEAGRHLPRVDAALALSVALGTDVDLLFASAGLPVDVVSGEVPADGTVLRASRVGDRLVSTPARIGIEGWDVGDGALDGDTFDWFGRRGSGLVVAGCEPGLEVLERLLRERGRGAVAAAATSESALAALAAGRVHAAVVHGPGGGAFRAPAGVEIERFGLAGWRVGLAASPDAASGWWRSALAGREPVIQRSAGAGVQLAFERARTGGGGVPAAGPPATTHLEAARRAVAGGVPAVTIEPAALAVGAAFHPLETHQARLWVDRRWSGARATTEAMDVIAGRAFRGRLEGVGGYDLSECGSRLA